jgi:hypothetical protein
MASICKIPVQYLCYIIYRAFTKHWIIFYLLNLLTSRFALNLKYLEIFRFGRNSDFFMSQRPK